ncbi:site-specific integrase [Achromobacter insolitus]|uniref:site-specific integrase n=1 Tax=Achromobacter insolitus TaxID=217204 RepID=UPI0011EB8C15|nr:site-specific integrase [Achromobacter insolitus]QEK90880.1 site-specific integrase [Achromobacter insolitus]
MATIVKSPAGTWKAVIRKAGWPTASKTFRTKRDAEDWARRTEDQMVRGVYIQRAPAERMSVETALKRYLKEVTPTKRQSTQIGERKKAQALIQHLGKYSLAALSADVVAQYRDTRLAGDKNERGKVIPRSNNTVRLELALLSHLFTVAIKEWGIGLPSNPVSNIRRPAPGAGRNRRLTKHEQMRLLTAVDKYSNPMFGWIVRIAIETGMRLSEISTLRIHQVEIDRRLVRLDLTKNSSPRTVPLTVEAARVMTEALANPLRPAETDLVFFGEPGKDGKRRPYLFDKAWKDAKRTADLEDFRFHDLRHEAVSRFVEAGLSDQEVSAISGHKSMQMLKRYTHLRAEDLVEKLDKLRV